MSDSAHRYFLPSFRTRILEFYADDSLGLEPIDGLSGLAGELVGLAAPVDRLLEGEDERGKLEGDNGE